MRTSTRTVAICFAFALTACADVSESEPNDGDVTFVEGDEGVALQDQALINPNVTANPIGTLVPTFPLDPGGVVLGPAPGGTKKTPCEKATNQFYRAQAAYLAAADALRACGFGFEPQCAELAAAFEVAAQTLDAAYDKFLAQCP